MLFIYKAIDASGTKREGNIDAINMDVAINALQRRGFIISSIISADKRPFWQQNLTFFERVTNKDLVIFSRQISTLFNAKVSALRIFQLLAEESENMLLQRELGKVAKDIQEGSSISGAMAKRPEVFSDYYVNMVRSGEESGKLDETFLYLADFLDRNYEITTKARNALFYPAFVVGTFITVMILMLTLVIPQLATILLDSGVDIPIYTKIVIALSSFLVNWWVLGLAGLALFVILTFQYTKTEEGKYFLSNMKLKVPYIGDLYEKLYLARISDNFFTLLHSGIPMVRVIELTAKVVDNKIFEDVLLASVEDVRAGSPLSEALSKHPEIPRIMVQMIKVGEETGEVGSILETLAKFYQREVSNAVDTLVDLIEPIMIVFLGLGVGTLLASILIPIYDIAGNF
jgi:type IV pilus assembly protein PilC